MRRTYPSDLSEARWKILQPIVQDERPRPGRKRSTDLREVINAIHYRWTTGCPWRMLPHDYPAWETVYAYFHRWQQDGRLSRIREVLLRKSPYVPVDESFAISGETSRLSWTPLQQLARSRREAPAEIPGRDAT